MSSGMRTLRMRSSFGPSSTFGLEHLLMAVMGAALGMGTRGLLNAWFGDAVPFVFALPAVFVVGWFAGVGAAAITVALSVAWLLVPWLVPTLTPEHGWRPALYFIPSGLIVGFFAARLRGAIRPRVQTPEDEHHGGLRWLWAVVVLAGAVPFAMFVATGVSLYNQTLADASARVERAARIGEEHALKVFETNIALLNRVLDAMGDDPDERLVAREAQLHQQLRRMSANLAQLQGIFLIDATGRMIATNRVYPAPRQTDFSDRPAFVHHRGAGAQPYMSDVLTSRTTGEPFFDLSLRRSHQDGSFGGTVSTSMAPSYFAAFYREIAGDAANLSVALLRADGALLAGWPQRPTAADAAAGSAGPSGQEPVALPPSAGVRHGTHPTAVRRIGNYPVFVSVSMASGAVLAPWYGQMVLMLALTFPAASGLMYVGWVALKRTRHAMQVAQALQVETQSRKLVEDSLRQAQKMEAIGLLTGGVAHDFNNLLQIIAANLHLIRREAAGNSAICNRVSNAGDAVERGARLTSQLLLFGRRQPLEPRVVDVGRLLSGMDDMLRRAIGDTIELNVIVAPGLWKTFADPTQTENAILNLVINARDAMGGVGQLTIEASNGSLDDDDVQRHADVAAGAYVMVAVTDTGGGMTPEVAAHVFEPFFTTKPAGSGTGLGLSMVYGFVKQSAGHVNIDSEVGRGTTITLYLPRSSQAEPAAAAAEAAPVAAGNETMLAVEE